MEMYLEGKCRILAEFADHFNGTGLYQEFFHLHRLGVAYAYGITLHHIVLMPEGKTLLNDAWVDFCEMMNVDPLKSYKDLTGVWDSSMDATFAMKIPDE